jgi:hypothetical protein
MRLAFTDSELDRAERQPADCPTLMPSEAYTTVFVEPTAVGVSSLGIELLLILPH